MDDRRLLEKAAKAAGLQFSDGRQLNPRVYLVRAAGEEWRGWNPLTDDGDALRLAVRLQIDIDFVSHHAPGHIVVFTDGNWSEFCDPDPYAATRRAIVRAAAAIGESA